VALNSAGAIYFRNATNLGSGAYDVNISRQGVNILQIGNGSGLNASGSLLATNATLSGTLTNSGIASDATHTDTTVCQDTTSHTFYAGSGAAGICLGTSGRRFKKDFGPMSMGLREINALKPFSFHYIKGYGDDGARKQIGFVAEDVQQVMPSLVGLDKDGKAQSVDYMGVMIVATKAIQELSAKVDAQQREINRLKRQLRKRTR
jgi:hypothetical protein